MNSCWHYFLYGFHLSSEIELPELVYAGEVSKAPDVVIRFGDVPERLAGAAEQGACYAAIPGEMLFWLAGVARFHVIAGREIVINPEPEAALETLRCLVLTSPIAALLLQRGLVPLHACAVATGQGAVVFVGGASLGKSTLAAALHQRGLIALADDIVAVQINPTNHAVVLPGYPALRLWPDAIRALGMDVKSYPTLRPGLKKRRVSLTGPFPREGVPISAIYIFDSFEQSPEKMPPRQFSGTETMAALLYGVYRLGFARGLGLERQVFTQVADLAKTIPIKRLVVDPLEFDPKELGRRVYGELSQ